MIEGAIMDGARVSNMFEGGKKVLPHWGDQLVQRKLPCVVIQMDIKSAESPLEWNGGEEQHW